MSLQLPQNCVMHNYNETDMKGRLLQKTKSGLTVQWKVG